MNGHGRNESRRKWKFSSIHDALGVLLFSVLLLASCHTAAADSAHSQQQYPSGPWGLGVVVPENSRFTDGSSLSWANVSAVSVDLTLPNITFSDYPTLAVESLMAADGSVMQIAAGIYPGHAVWLGYGWFIANVKAYPQSYVWVLNASKPEMVAGTPISLSIYLSHGRWEYRIEDLSTGEVTAGEYAATVPPGLKVGDQEVFALESYSTSSPVFEHMGNLTLDALRIDGKQIASGFYGYGSWDTRHNPLFVVGGLDPPSYISLQRTGGELVWGYEQWSVNTPTLPQPFPLTIIVGVVALIGILALTGVYLIRRRTYGPTRPTQQIVLCV